VTHVTFWAKKQELLWLLGYFGACLSMEATFNDHAVESIVECHTAQTAWPNSKHHTHTSLLHIYICMLLEVVKATIWS